MDHLIYALINFALLAAIIFFAGRKMIARIFSDRRQRIEADLDQAEAALSATDTETEDNCISEAADELKAQAERIIASRGDEIKTEHRQSLERQRLFLESKAESMRRDMLDKEYQRIQAQAEDYRRLMGKEDCR